MFNNAYDFPIFKIFNLQIYLIIGAIFLLTAGLAILIKLYDIRFCRLAEEYRKNILLNKTWYRKFLIYFHGEAIFSKENITQSILKHNPKRAEIKYREKVMYYRKESNEIKLLCLLIQADGDLVSSARIVKELDMPQSYEVDMNTKG